jgi:hypothetical protein
MTATAKRPGDGHFSLFVDESGNTGRNLIDAAQPVYILAGWFVPDTAIPAVNRLMADLQSDLASKAREIHASQVLRTRKGRDAFAPFLKQMGAVGGWPVFQLVEKRYWIAGKVVETFLDHEYNTSVSPEFFNDIEKKQLLANELCELPDEYLHEFAVAYREMNLEQLTRSAQRFSVLYKLRNHPELERNFGQAVVNLADVVRDESAVNDSLPHNVMQSVNLPVLVTFLSQVEDLARRLGLQSLKIVHDESREFAPGIAWLLSKYTHGKGDSTARMANDYLVDFTFEKIVGFDMVASDTSAGVQAADLLASALNLYSRTAAKGGTPDPWLVEALEPILGAAIFPAYFDVPHLARLTGSPTFVGSVFRHLPTLRKAPRYDT